MTLAWIMGVSAEKTGDECDIGSSAVGKVSEAVDGYRVEV